MKKYINYLIVFLNGKYSEKSYRKWKKSRLSNVCKP